jgi:hypothetical protein
VTTDPLSEWQQLYQAALLECDPSKLSGRIEEAHRAIRRCMDMAAYGPIERQAMADALTNLRVLRREIRFPTNDSAATQEQA